MDGHMFPATKNGLDGYISQNGQECPICIESFTERDFLDEKIHKTVCDHYFHAICLEEWTEKHGSCPSCNGLINFDKEAAEWKYDLKDFASVVKKRFQPKNA